MSNSKELRRKAWDSLKDRYWMAFSVSLVTSIIYSVAGVFTNISQKIMEIPNSVDPSLMDDTAAIGAVVVSAIALIFACIGLIYSIFVSNPIMVGIGNYYIKNTDSKPSFKDAFSGFTTRYGRNIKTMFLIDIKVILWTILFIIPGIIKGYEYAIIPYILADDPEISTKDAFKKAKEMMNGNKWRLFKLSLSFIGWILLCIPTLGIGALFLAPYIEAATAEFYTEIKNK